MTSGGIAWFTRNPVAANLMMVFIIVSGVIASTSVTEEVFPEVDLDRISIQVPYLGAAPEEVEEAVVIRIEEAIQGVDGIKQIVSTASEGNASVMVELELGADSRRVVDEVKNNVDAIITFPLETEKPIVRELTNRRQVTDIAIAGNGDIFALKTFAEQVRDELSAHPEITQVEIVSAPPYEISIEVSEAALRRHGLTFDQVANAVRRSSLDLPGGSVRSDGGEILLRTIGQAYRGREFEELVLWTRPDGSRLRLADVATVVDGFEETDQLAWFNQDPTVMVSVFRTGDQSALDISAAAAEYVAEAQARLPDGVTLTIWQDQALVLNDRLSLMLRNAAAGFVLVFIILMLFLELRLAFWVSLGIPISFLGAIALMPGLDVSVNIISTFAFILVLGIVVDDAIIVGENIYRHQEEHGDGLRGSIEGAREIATPVTFAVLTTVAAFMPLMFVPGMMGKIFRVIPLIVIPALLFSLIESLGILPAHLSRIPKRRSAPGPWRRFQGLFSNGLKLFIRRVYRAVHRARHALAVRDRGDRPRNADSHRRHGAGRLGHLSLLPLDRGGLHVGVGDNAAGKPRRGHGRGGRAARGGRGAGARPPVGRDRHGLLPTCLGGGGRSADGVPGRPDETGERDCLAQHRRGDHRTGAGRDPVVHQRADQHDVARDDRADPGSGRRGIQRLDDERRGRRRCAARRAGP